MRETPLIAIVDDDEPLRLALGNLLRSAGYDVELFEDAEHIMDGISPGQYDLVLTDYRMPGANGAELTSSIRASGCVAPVIIMTAQSLAEVEIEARAAGAVTCIRKPFDEDGFLDIIKESLSRAPDGNRKA